MYRFSERARFGVFPEWKEADHTTEMVYTFGHPFDVSVCTIIRSYRKSRTVHETKSGGRTMHSVSYRD